MPVSIKDIAKAADVSYSTVSRALADSPKISLATRERIKRLAAEMGYTPSAAARSLVTSRTHTIGIIATTVTDPFQAEIIEAVEEIALASNYTVTLTQSGARSDRELLEIRALREGRVDGIVLVSLCADGDYESLLQGSGSPLVFINESRSDSFGYSVRADSFAGAQQAVSHLLNLGHRRIAYVGGPDNTRENAQRRAGYEQALVAHGLPVEPDLIVNSFYHVGGVASSMRQLLSLHSPPTAVFCYDDTTALKAMRALYAVRLRVPQDISIVGFDDIQLSSFFEPPLTTVAQPKWEMGQKAVQIILDLAAGREPLKDCVLPARLVIRESTCRLGRDSFATDHVEF